MYSLTGHGFSAVSDLDGLTWADDTHTEALVWKAVDAQSLKAELDAHKETVAKVDFQNGSGLTGDVTNLFSTLSNLKTIDFKGSFSLTGITSLASMFSGCSALEGVLNLSSFNTSSVTNMASMFNGCSNLSSIVLTSFNTAAVTDMSYMFQNCRSLTGLDLTNFDTEAVTDMGYMFYGCSGLTELDLSSFNTTKVTRLTDIFALCSSLTSLDLSSFRTASVWTMIGALWGCSNLTYVNMQNFDTSGLKTQGGGARTGMYQFFYKASKLDTVIMGPNCKIPLIKNNFDCAFPSKASGGKLGWTTKDSTGGDVAVTNVPEYQNAHLDTEHTYTGSNVLWNSTHTEATVCQITDGQILRAELEPYASTLQKVIFTDGTGLTGSCDNLVALPRLKEISIQGSFVSSGVTSMKAMFQGCSLLSSLNLSAFDTTNVTDMSEMFEDCASLNILNLKNFNTANVTKMGEMFAGCSFLSSLDITSFDTQKVDDMNQMFEDCEQLYPINLSSFKTSSVINMSQMFEDCHYLVALDVSKFDTSNVSNMSQMFNGCSSLNVLDVSKFDMKKVNSTSGMFEDCSALSDLKLPSFQGVKLTNTNRMFRDCPNLESLDLSSLDTSDVTTMVNMFSGCDDLSSLTLGKNTKLLTGSGLPGINNSTNPFWIVNMTQAVSYNTSDQSSVAAINAVLGGLEQGLTCTFTKATMRLTYDANGGYYENNPSITQEYLYGNPGDVIEQAGGFNYTPVPQTASGLAYLGYAASQGSSVVATPIVFPQIAANTTFYAIWKDAHYVTITLQADGGTFASTGADTLVMANQLSGSRLLDVERPTKEGYRFNTWKDASGQTVSFPYIVPDVDTVLTATWTAKTYTVSFDSAGGSFITPQRVSYGSHVTRPTDPIRSGYTFGSWQKDGNEWNFASDVVTGDMTLSAIWNAIPAPPAPAHTPGWIWEDGGWKYENADGSYDTNEWKVIDGFWYYFKEDGVIMSNCWAWVGDAWYGFWANGAMCTGWVWDSGYSDYFYCGTDGRMVKGVWAFVDGEWYGFWGDGTMCRGWIWDSGWNAWFYCYANGIMARNTVIGGYQVNASGIWMR